MLSLPRKSKSTMYFLQWTERTSSTFDIRARPPVSARRALVRRHARRRHRPRRGPAAWHVRELVLVLDLAQLHVFAAQRAAADRVRRLAFFLLVTCTQRQLDQQINCSQAIARQCRARPQVLHISRLRAFSNHNRVSSLT